MTLTSSADLDDLKRSPDESPDATALVGQPLVAHHLHRSSNLQIIVSDPSSVSTENESFKCQGSLSTRTFTSAFESGIYGRSPSSLDSQSSPVSSALGLVCKKSPG